MPVYEYRCEKCGHVSSFVEKMFERPRLFARKKRCGACGAKKLVKIPSAFGVSVERSRNEMLNELKSLGNVQFVPRGPEPTPTGPPPGGCPYCQEKPEDDAKPKPAETLEVR